MTKCFGLYRENDKRNSLLKKLKTETFRGNTENIMLTPHYISRSERSDKIRVIRCITDAFKNSFFPRTISEHSKIKIPKEGNMKYTNVRI
jgi:hypothetical protein